jgi:hypothetical protein
MGKKKKAIKPNVSFRVNSKGNPEFHKILSEQEPPRTFHRDSAPYALLVSSENKSLVENAVPNTNSANESLPDKFDELIAEIESCNDREMLEFYEKMYKYIQSQASIRIAKQSSVGFGFFLGKESEFINSWFELDKAHENALKKIEALYGSESKIVWKDDDRGYGRFRSYYLNELPNDDMFSPYWSVRHYAIGNISYVDSIDNITFAYSTYSGKPILPSQKTGKPRKQKKPKPIVIQTLDHHPDELGSKGVSFVEIKEGDNVQLATIGKRQKKDKNS